MKKQSWRQKKARRCATSAKQIEFYRKSEEPDAAGRREDFILGKPNHGAGA